MDSTNTAKTVVIDNDDELSWILPECREFYTKHLQKTTRVKKRVGLLKLSMNQAYGLKRRYKDALFLEFGVHEGKDAVKMAKLMASIDTQQQQSTPTILHAFDSFEGLPEDWHNGQFCDDGSVFHKEGHFDVQGALPAVTTNNIVFHKGWFAETVPKFFAEQQHLSAHAIAFVHADADLCSSTYTFLQAMCERKLLKRGTVIVFDEYWNYPNCFLDGGEYRAWQQVVKDYDLQYEYWAYHGQHDKQDCYYGYQSVCVVVLKDMV